MSFETVYQAALNLDEVALKMAMVTGSIDQWKTSTLFVSAAAQLTSEGRFKSVEFLLNHGANINFVVFAAAASGQIIYMNELMLRGASATYAAVGTAMNGDVGQTTRLLKRGADPRYVVFGASMGKSKDYANELLTKYPLALNMAIEGAALSENWDYVDELLNKDNADINSALKRAAHLGNQERVKVFLSRANANRSYAILGAAQGGLIDDAKEMDEEANHNNWIISGATDTGSKFYIKERQTDILLRSAARSGHTMLAQELLRQKPKLLKCLVDASIISKEIHKRGESTLRFLSFYEPNEIRRLVKDLRERIKNPVSTETELRAIAVAKNRKEAILTHSLAMIRTDPKLQGMLYLAMLLSMGSTRKIMGEIRSLPWELWLHIFNFITPTRITCDDIEQLGFINGRAHFRAQLSCYLSTPNTNKQRAKSFLKAVSSCRTKEDLGHLLNQQTKILQDRNPYAKKDQHEPHQANIVGAPDRFHHIIGFWEKKRTGKAVTFANINPPNSNKTLEAAPNSDEVDYHVGCSLSRLFTQL